VKIDAWVGLQDELSDLEMMLSVDNLEAVEKQTLPMAQRSVRL
jgi:hypothetical protein